MVKIKYFCLLKWKTCLKFLHLLSMTTTIFEHRTIRRYKPDLVPSDILTTLLKAATRASNTGNMQVYSIIVSTLPEIKEQLYYAHFKQEMVRQAPLVLTFCADFNRFDKWCRQRKADPGYDNYLSFYTATIDALLAAQNFCLAAEAHQLGICYLGTTTYMAAEIVKILNLPNHVVPVTTVVAGYPDEAPAITDRLPLEGIVHHEKYSDYTADQIDHIYQQKEMLPQTAELLKINNKETLAQIFTDKRYTRKDNKTFSKSFLKVIEDQGFMNNND